MKTAPVLLQKGTSQFNPKISNKCPNEKMKMRTKFRAKFDGFGQTTLLFSIKSSNYEIIKPGNKILVVGSVDSQLITFI